MIHLKAAQDDSLRREDRGRQVSNDIKLFIALLKALVRERKLLDRQVLDPLRLLAPSSLPLPRIKRLLRLEDFPLPTRRIRTLQIVGDWLLFQFAPGYDRSRIHGANLLALELHRRAQIAQQIFIIVAERLGLGVGGPERVGFRARGLVKGGTATFTHVPEVLFDLRSDLLL